jgi:transposase
MRWKSAWERGGRRSLSSRGRPGFASSLEAQHRRRLATLLLDGAEAFGYRNALWTLPRIRQLVLSEFGVRLGETQIWNILRQMNWTPQRPVCRARQRDEAGIRRWKRVEWPRIKERARRERRTLVFIDETGLSEKPHRARTWAPKGQTPVLEFNFNWKQLSAQAALSQLRFYIRFHQGAIRSPQVVAFLKHLRRQVRGNILVVWDLLPAHRSKMVADFIAAAGGRIAVEWLPPYAPELNPVEYLWAHWKSHELANLCPKDLWDLSDQAKRALRRMRGKPRLITACWVQAELL